MRNDLYVRIGNSSLEFAEHSKKALRSPVSQWEPLLKLLKRKSVKRVVFSSVNPPMSKILKKHCGALKIVLLEIKSKDVPLKAPYVKTIGVDRLLNVYALSRRVRSSFVLVDLGTATTVEFFDLKRGYLGGWIAPGMSMLAESMTEKAALLPQVDLRKLRSLSGILGANTEETLLLGIRTILRGIFVEAKKTGRQQFKGQKVQFFVAGGGVRRLGPLKGWKVAHGLQLEALQKIADNK